MYCKACVFSSIVFAVIGVFSVPSNAQTYAALTGKTFAAWKETYDYNIKQVCPDIKKRINDPSIQESLIIENTMAITGAYAGTPERFISKADLESFKKIVAAQKKFASKAPHPNKTNPKDYMKSFDFYGYCICLNDVSKFMPSEQQYNAVAVADMQSIEDAQKMKCIVANARL